MSLKLPSAPHEQPNVPLIRFPARSRPMSRTGIALRIGITAAITTLTAALAYVLAR